MVEFEWDEDKRLSNFVKHGLDFEQAILCFDGRPKRTIPSDFENEARFVTTAIVEERFVTVVWTWREDRIRIISFRRSRDAEKRSYRSIYG